MATPRFTPSRHVVKGFGTSLCTCVDYPGYDGLPLTKLDDMLSEVQARDFQMVTATLLLNAGFGDIADEVAGFAYKHLFPRLEVMEIADAVIWYAIRAVKDAAAESIFPRWKGVYPQVGVAEPSPYKRQRLATAGVAAAASAAAPAADATIKSPGGPHDIIGPYSVAGRKVLTGEPASDTGAASAAASKLQVPVAPAVNTAPVAATASAAPAAPAAPVVNTDNNNYTLGSPKDDTDLDFSLSRRHCPSGREGRRYTSLAKSLTDGEADTLLKNLRVIFQFHDEKSGRHGMKYLQNFPICMPKDGFTLALDTQKVPEVFVFHALYGGVDPGTRELAKNMPSAEDVPSAKMVEIAADLFPKW